MTKAPPSDSVASKPGYVDVDRWLLDVSRAKDHVESARIRAQVAGFKSLDALERHVRRLAEDPDYLDRCNALTNAAEDWKGDLEAFVEHHADLAHDIGLARSWSRRPSGLLWTFKRAPSKVADLRSAQDALVALTGSTNLEDAWRSAHMNTAVVTPAVLEDSFSGVDSAEHGRWSSTFMKTRPHREVLLQADYAIQHDLEDVARSGLEVASANESDKRLSAIGLLARVCREMDRGWLPHRARDEVRDALGELGFPLAESDTELARQAQAAANAHPDHLREVLSVAKFNANELMRLTGESRLPDARRRATEILNANRPYAEAPRRGVIVFSGGLPTLGRRR